MSDDRCFDETDPQTTIELILHRIETGMTTEGDVIWLKHYLLVQAAQIDRLQERVDVLEGLYRIGEF